MSEKNKQNNGQKKRGTRKPGGDDMSITLIAMAAQVRRACPTHQAAYTKYVQISVYQLKDRKEKEEKKKRRDASAVKWAKKTVMSELKLGWFSQAFNSSWKFFRNYSGLHDKAQIHVKSVTGLSPVTMEEVSFLTA